MTKESQRLPEARKDKGKLLPGVSTNKRGPPLPRCSREETRRALRPRPGEVAVRHSSPGSSPGAELCVT